MVQRVRSSTRMNCQRTPQTPSLLPLASILLCAAISACGSAKVSGRREIAAPTAPRPSTVYVMDFELEVANVKHERGFLPPPPPAPGPLGQILPPLPGTPKDPQKLKTEVVNTMSESLVKELTKAGLHARRIGTREPLPATGWLVRGVFTNVNQGHQLQRAVIGFGMGKTDLQIVVDLHDLASGVPTPFYEASARADSGKAPGAGPTIVLGPAGIAARVVLAGGDLNRNVKQSAEQIANEIAERAKGTRS